MSRKTATMGAILEQLKRLTGDAAVNLILYFDLYLDENNYLDSNLDPG